MSAADATLVVLAAGRGSRFGGPKQLTPVGPQGQVILDYSMAGARAAGIESAVLVVSSDIEGSIGEHVRHDPRVAVVCQDRHPLARRAAAGGRVKPLGTAHATLVGMEAAPGRAVLVVNADDLYGDEAFRLLAAELGRRTGVWGALATFAVGNTMTGTGSVTRALCDVGADGMLRGIEEGTVTGAVWSGVSGRQVELAGDEPVSMNCWGFPAMAVDRFADAARRFVDSARVDTGDEVLLPDVARSMLADGVPFAAPACAGRCLGITHPGDLALVRAVLAGSAGRGHG